MFTSVQPQIAEEIGRIRADGLYKTERVIASPQRANIVVSDGKPVLNLCANNYLGLADDSRIIHAAKDALNRWGFGMASVRFICGTQDLHKQLERKLSAFLGTVGGALGDRELADHVVGMGGVRERGTPQDQESTRRYPPPSRQEIQ